MLVVPVNDHLKRIERLGETEWRVEDKLSVSFASLIEPSVSGHKTELTLREYPLPPSVIYSQHQSRLAASEQLAECGLGRAEIRILKFVYVVHTEIPKWSLAIREHYCIVNESKLSKVDGSLREKQEEAGRLTTRKCSKIKKFIGNWMI